MAPFCAFTFFVFSVFLFSMLIVGGMHMGSEKKELVHESTCVDVDY